MYRASKNSLPNNIQNLFKVRDAHHNYNLRGTNQLYQPNVRTELKSMCISRKGITLWNKLAVEIKSCTTLIQLKKMFKRHVMSDYLEELM